MFKNIKTAEQLEQEKHEAETQEIRRERDRRLSETDYLVMPDYPMADQTAVEAYRQALRDITVQPDFPENISWPEKP